MDIPYTVRQELNNLSKEVFGASSKWQKFVKGVPELVTKTVTETVPGDKGAPDTTRQVQVPVLADNGAKQYKTRFYSLEEVKNLLLDAKKIRDEMQAKMKAKQEQEKLEKAVQEKASGTVLKG